MDEVIINQTKYISSKRASKATGYAKDYIGQLVRMGKLKATKVGRAWFVDERALMTLITGKRDLPAVSTKQHSTLRPTTPAALKSIASVSYPKTWSSIKYLSDDSDLLPTSDRRDTIDLIDISGSRTANIPDKSDFTSDFPTEKVFIRRNATRRAVSVRSMDGIRVSVSESAYSEPHAGLEHAARAHQQLRLGTTDRYANPGLLQNILRVSVSALIVSFVALLIPLLG
jgi:hypothetical protein